MSHGSEEGLVFPDGEELDVMRFVQSVQKSSFYQEKPKLFFIQACRGRQKSGGLSNSTLRSKVTKADSFDNVASVFICIIIV